MADDTQRDKLIQELTEIFPKDYIWSDKDYVVFTMCALCSRDDGQTLRDIVQRYEHLFTEIQSITMPGQFHIQLTFIGK